MPKENKIRLFFLKLRKRKTYRRRSSSQKSKAEHTLHKTSALTLVTSRLSHFASIYKTTHQIPLTYHRVTIRNQSSRWGSCSRKGNLSFNYRIALLPPELADYIIVHELCHLGEFNHSKKFWDLVEKTIPNWPQLRAELKVYNKTLF